DGRRPSVGGILAKVGEHTDEVLGSLGVSAAELATLRESKVVG
ncbi:MAG: CoA transferase, partial [Gammaproteobacteria bacterium]|nr:CoA transferase [Gammaproteobacteria bacterium]